MVFMTTTMVTVPAQSSSELAGLGGRGEGVALARRWAAGWRGGSPSAPWAQSPGRRGNGVSCGLRAAPRPGADIGVNVVLIHFVIWFLTCWRRK